VSQNANNLDALFLSGTLARLAGDTRQARHYWEQLLPQLAPGSRAYQNVKANLDAL
jgi:cytochrome c-type biogenesis protein CcmH/NrfG